jgi:hypothetical protein
VRNVKASKKYAGDQAQLDPFCSSACAHRWHGVNYERTEDEAA